MEKANPFGARMLNTVNLAPMVRMNTTPFRQLCLKHGADYVYTEEIIDRKLVYCKRVENQEMGTVDFVSTRDYNLVLRTSAEERSKLIL